MIQKFFQLVPILFLLFCGATSGQASPAPLPCSGGISQKCCDTWRMKMAMKILPCRRIKIEIHALGSNMADMHFDVPQITVPSASFITIILINDGTDPSMVQNIVIIKPGDADSVALHGLYAGESKNYVAHGKEVIAASKLVQPGKKTILKFRAPQKGEYEFISTYPGHYLNMKGKFTVQ